jgi:hypothetical protein
MKLTSALLRKIIEEEVGKFGKPETTEKRAKETEEVDADELGDDKVAAKHIDYYKALKIEETRIRRRLNKIQEIKKRMSSRAR